MEAKPTIPPLAKADRHSSTLPAESSSSARASEDGEIPLPEASNDPVTAFHPYWSEGTRHARSASYNSIGHQRPPAITLEDHTEDDNQLSQSCWAQSATIDEWVLVSGATGIGAYVVWHCTVKTLKGGDMTIRKRYNSHLSY